MNKQVRDMTDQEFEMTFGFDRALARAMMLNTKCSPLPDRPMHPKAKISCKDDGIVEKQLARDWLYRVEKDVMQRKINELISISSLNRTSVKGEINS